MPKTTRRSPWLDKCPYHFTHREIVPSLRANIVSDIVYLNASRCVNDAMIWECDERGSVVRIDELRRGAIKNALS